MSLVFGALTIPGLNGPVVVSPPDPAVQYFKFFDLFGQVSVHGQGGGRDLRCEIIIHNNFPTRLALEEFLNDLDVIVGEFGPLVATTNPDVVHDSCHFIGFERLPLGAQEGAGVLRDDGGCLDGGFWIFGALHFRQLGAYNRRP